MSLTNIKDSEGDLVSIIDDVDSVTVGIKNTDLEVVDVTAKTADGNETADKFPGQEIYTLWKSGYIRAAVVIGEDQGVSSNYAYVTSGSVTQEAYDKTTKEYTWSREVVINGELTKITYVGDTIDQIGNNATNTGDMRRGEWYKVTYYADGTVKSAVEQTFGDAGDEFMANINEIETAVKLDKTLILHQTGMSGSLKYENGSLYYVTDNKTGFSVSPDVKVVVANAKKGTGDNFNTVEDGYTGYNGLEDAIDDLNHNFTGELNAILEGGVATTIIINCTAKDDGYNPGEVTGSTVYKTDLVVGGDGKVTLRVNTKDGSNVPADVEFKYTMTSSSLISDSKTSVSGEGKIASGSNEGYIKFGTPNQMLKYQAVVTIGNDTIETNVLFG